MAYSATCKFEKDDQTVTSLYASSGLKAQFVAESFSVKFPSYAVDLYDPDGNIVYMEASNKVVNVDVYRKTVGVTFTKIGNLRYTLKTGNTVICYADIEVKTPTAASCSVTPKTSVEGGANYTLSAVLKEKSTRVAFEVYVDGVIKAQGDGWADGEGKLANFYNSQYHQFSNGRHTFALYSKGGKLCEDYVDVGDYPACQAELSDYNLSYSYDKTKVHLKNVQNCASGCNYVVKLGTQQFLSGSKSIQQSWDATEIGTISGMQLERGNHQITVELTNSLGSGSCSFWLNRW